MERRTSNIILIIKGNHNYEENGVKVSSKQAIAKYMAETCAIDEKFYDDFIILKIIQSVVLDFIKTADNPESLLFDYFEAAQRHNTIESWCTALRRIQIRELIDGYYNKGFAFVNGFNEDNIDVISENTGKKMFEEE